MPQRFLFFCLSIWLFTLGSLHAQQTNAISTYASSNSAICQGGTFKVWFLWSGTFAANNVFTVQVSDGGDFKNLVTGTPQYDADSRTYTLTATLSATYAAGNTYRYRVVSSNPAVISNPVFPAQLAVKLKPAPPMVDSVQTFCQSTNAMQFSQGHGMSMRILSGATPRLVDAQGSAPYNTSNVSGQFAYFQLTGSLNYGQTYRYPIGENTYFASQVVDGCESDKIPTKRRILFTIAGYPIPANRFAAEYGKITYCQGEQAQPLNVNGHSEAPFPYRVLYQQGQNFTFSSVVPTPSTSSIGGTSYMLKFESTDPSKACTPSNTVGSVSYLTVDVLARPVKPLVSATSVTVCQGQTANVLSATAIDATATLMWYGRDATGGTASTAATRPTTDQAGTFKYYVAQRLNSCDGERSEITVVVRPRPALPSVASSVSLCSQPCLSGSTCSYVFSGTPTAGGSLNWYNVASGGQALSNYGSGISSPSSIAIYTFSISKQLYISQLLDGCESDRAVMSVDIIQSPDETPANPYNFNDYAVCQRTSGTITLDKFHRPTPAGLKAIYLVGGTYTYVPPSIDLTKEGRFSYQTLYENEKGCRTFVKFNEDPFFTQVSAIVKPQPAKPTTTTASLCQYQTAVPLSATASEGGSLRWYGTSATGGTAATAAPSPGTERAGTFRYYVAQVSANACESERAEVAVEVKEASAPPTVSNVSYCQGDAAGQLSAVAASGGTLRWYTTQTGGTGAAVGPSPTTNTVGGLTVYVAQSVNGACESQRVPLQVTINAIPVAPAPVVPTAYCQNAASADLTATGQNLKWYETATGGIATGTLKPSTVQPGTRSYFVTQTVNNCESARSSVNVTVKPLPPAPTSATPTTLCQFAPNLTLSANGQNLTWFNADGTVFSTNGQGPIVVADAGKSVSYGVSQTVEGCTGPRTAIGVTVQTTPAPTVAKATVEVCQGATAQVLEATASQGSTGLRWTDPTGTTSAAAPTPATTNATKNPDGAPYYVTQIGANGCESPRATIRVFVQTVPTLSIAGTSMVNLGIEAPIKLTFTGVGPYSYTLSNGQSGSTTKDTTILVLPDKTTTYQVAQVRNRCGVGLPDNGGIVTITVQIPRIQTQALTTTTLCVGQPLTSNFTVDGTLNAGSVFKLQIARIQADSAAAQYVDLGAMQAGQTQVTGTLPRSLGGGTYWVRVIATNPKIPIAGSRSPNLLTVRPLPTATLSGTPRIYETQAASLSVSFTGDAPWTISYRDSSWATGMVGVAQTIQTTANPHVFEVRPTKSTTYLLTTVSNNCGTGVLAGSRTTITVDALLATQEPFIITAFPVPAATSIRLNVEGASIHKPAEIDITNLNGTVLSALRTTQRQTDISLEQLPAGTYLLRVTQQGQQIIRKIVKQ
jgi:hypothetical protein